MSKKKSKQPRQTFTLWKKVWPLFFMSFPLCLSLPVGDLHLLQHTRPPNSFLPPSFIRRFPPLDKRRYRNQRHLSLVSYPVWLSCSCLSANLPLPCPSVFTLRSRILETMTYNFVPHSFTIETMKWIILDKWVSVLYIQASLKQNVSPLLISRGVNICKFSMNLCLSFLKAFSQF